MKSITVQILSLAIMFLVGFASDAKLMTYSENIYQVQQKLQALGYDPGPIDGTWGAKTARALRSFQQAHGLPMTGAIDEKTKAKLEETVSLSGPSVRDQTEQGDHAEVTAGRAGLSTDSLVTGQSRLAVSPPKVPGSNQGGTMMMIFVIGGVVTLVAIVAVFMHNGAVRIGEHEVGIVFKKFTLRPSRRVPPTHQGDQRIALYGVALYGEAGLQADTLPPGIHWGKWPWMYTIRKVPWIKVRQGEIALVVAKYGMPLPPGQRLGQVIVCDKFQDARAFLTKGGQQGPQLDILTAGEYRINTELFDVITSDNADQHGTDAKDLRVYRVEPDKVGIVTTTMGAEPPEGEIAGPCIEGHNNFQDGQKFIDAKGWIGLQEQVLLPTTYTLNPWFVHIEQVPLVDIPTGTVGVVSSSVGKESTEADEPLVERGYKGMWKTPLSPGKHPINTKVMRVEIVPTYKIQLDWSNDRKPDTNYDALLKALTLRFTDGFQFDIALTQVIRIKGEDAPKLLSFIGSPVEGVPEIMLDKATGDVKYRSIHNLVKRELEPLVANYFHNSLRDAEALAFLDRRSERRREAEEHIASALKTKGVQAEGTYFEVLNLPEQLIKLRQARTIAMDERKTLQEELLAEKDRQKRAEEQVKTKLIESKLHVGIAQQNAEVEGYKIQADEDRIRKISQAEAEAIQAKVEALGGPDAYKVIQFIEQLPHIQQDVPGTIVGGDATNYGLFGLLKVFQALGLATNDQKPSNPDVAQHLFELLAVHNNEHGKLAYMRLKSLLNNQELDNNTIQEIASILLQLASGSSLPQISTNDGRGIIDTEKSD